MDYAVVLFAAAGCALAFFDFLHGVAEVRTDRALRQLAHACAK